MALIAKGDAEKLEYQKGLITLFSVLLVLSWFYLGVVVFVPKHKGTVTCTYTRSSWFANGIIALSPPSSRITCHG